MPKPRTMLIVGMLFAAGVVGGVSGKLVRQSAPEVKFASRWKNVPPNEVPVPKRQDRMSADEENGRQGAVETQPVSATVEPGPVEPKSKSVAAGLTPIENGRQQVGETQYRAATVEPGQFGIETQKRRAGLTNSVDTQPAIGEPGSEPMNGGRAAIPSPGRAPQSPNGRQPDGEAQRVPATVEPGRRPNENHSPVAGLTNSTDVCTRHNMHKIWIERAHWRSWRCGRS